MSANVLHLNLLNPHERRSSSPVRAKILLPIGAGLCFVFVLIWVLLLTTQVVIANSRLGSVRGTIASLQGDHARFEALRAQFRDLQAEADQYAYYGRGRRRYGELLRLLAYALPDGVTLTALTLPEPKKQDLQPPPGSKAPPLQGPKETDEPAELRLTGLAHSEQDVFQLMRNMRDETFTNWVVITEHSARTKAQDESPRVIDFRQEQPTQPNGRRDVYFDIAYTLKPREFVK